MSRIAKNPINFGDAQVTLEGKLLIVKGSKGALNLKLPEAITVEIQDKSLQVSPKDASTMANALAGTTSAHITNAIEGVVTGFKKVLQLVGVGYRANVQGKKINLVLGYSHPRVYEIPEGITITTPTPTEIVIQGFNKQLVGQVAAEIRQYRPPEPYKGKGVRYTNERIKLKETKKK